MKILLIALNFPHHPLAHLFFLPKAENLRAFYRNFCNYTGGKIGWLALGRQNVVILVVVFLYKSDLKLEIDSKMFHLS